MKLIFHMIFRNKPAVLIMMMMIMVILKKRKRSKSTDFSLQFDSCREKYRTHIDALHTIFWSQFVGIVFIFIFFLKQIHNMIYIVVHVKCTCVMCYRITMMSIILNFLLFIFLNCFLFLFFLLLLFVCLQYFIKYFDT